MPRFVFLLIALCALVFGFTCGILYVLDPPQRVPQIVVPRPEPEPTPADPLQTYLDGISGTKILFVSTEHCPPCVEAERKIVPWLQRHRWPVQKVDDAETAALLQVESFPTFIAIRDHTDVGRVTGCDYARLNELLVAAKGDRVDYLGSALAAHVLSHPRAGAAGEPAMGAPTGAGPVVAFPFGPSLSLPDLLRKQAGQEFTVGIATVKIPKDIGWVATREADHVHLDLQPDPTIGFTRFLRDIIALDAVDLTLDQATLRLKGFPDFSVRFAW